MTPIPDPFLAELVQDLRNSPAGRVLSQYSFKPVPQTETVVAYERQNENGTLTVICAYAGDGSGPTGLDERIELYTRYPNAKYDEYDDSFPSVSRYVELVWGK